MCIIFIEGSVHEMKSHPMVQQVTLNGVKAVKNAH